MLNEFIAWYFSPWRKIGRTPFNTALLLVNLPGLVSCVAGKSAPSQGGGNMSLMNTLMGGQGIGENGMADVQNLFANATTTPTEAGLGAADWAVLGIWLAFIPLVQMRLRDMGFKRQTVWSLTGVIYTCVGMEIISGLAGADLFGWVDTLAYMVSGAFVLWLCLAPSAVTERPVPVTPSRDDTDPFPPFRP